MKERKWTPGPWGVNQLTAHVMPADQIFDPAEIGSPICAMLHPTAFRNESETEANAHLIAAAPDLYHELEGANCQLSLAADAIEAGRLDEALLHCRSLSRLRENALAKARGEL